MVQAPAVSAPAPNIPFATLKIAIIGPPPHNTPLTARFQT
jgi:hypothetical protein